MKTVAIDHSSVLIPALATFIKSDECKYKAAPLSKDDDVERLSDYLISRMSNILCDAAEYGDLVVECIDKKDSEYKYWRHRLDNRVAGLYKLNRDKSLFDNIDKNGLEKVNANYFKWCADNNIVLAGLEGFEADDIIAALVKRSDKSIIISSDGDFNQLISSPSIIRIDPTHWRVFRCANDSDDWFGDSSFDNLWVDALLKTLELADVTLVNANYSLLVKILTGDKSDCIPSVHTHATSTGKTMGVGEKTASKMILSIFDSPSHVKRYEDLSLDEKRDMCSVLKDPDVDDVLKRMDENAEMVILNNNSLNEILNPVNVMVDNIMSSTSLFIGVNSTLYANPCKTDNKIEFPKEFEDYVFN